MRAQVEVCRNETRTQVNLRQACTIPQRVGDNRSHLLYFHIIRKLEINLLPNNATEHDLVLVPGSAIYGIGCCINLRLCTSH